jgi:hypothetical protein
LFGEKSPGKGKLCELFGWVGVEEFLFSGWKIRYWCIFVVEKKRITKYIGSKIAKFVCSCRALLGLGFFHVPYLALSCAAGLALPLGGGMGVERSLGVVRDMVHLLVLEAYYYPSFVSAA